MSKYRVVSLQISGQTVQTSRDGLNSSLLPTTTVCERRSVSAAGQHLLTVRELRSVSAAGQRLPTVCKRNSLSVEGQHRLNVILLFASKSFVCVSHSQNHPFGVLKKHSPVNKTSLVSLSSHPLSLFLSLNVCMSSSLPPSLPCRVTPLQRQVSLHTERTQGASISMPISDAG